ncbi:hypothetical protein ACLOJK_038471 [Asimina triloba]
MGDRETVIQPDFPLFSKKSTPKSLPKPSTPQQPNDTRKPVETNSDLLGFSELGLPEWAIQTCNELGIKKPTPVQCHCIPRILAGEDVLGLAQTGSGKTAAFALPILHRLAQEPYGVFALVMTPTRELAYQLAEQFRALGSCLHLRCLVVVGGMNMINQAQSLVQRPHVVIATPGRLKVLLKENPDIPSVFSRIKFLVLDEADRMLDAGFEEELKAIFQCVPKNRQTLLFSATMTDELKALHQLSANKAYFYEAYEGFKTVETLKQQFILVPKNVKDVYLFHILSKMEDEGIRSAIVFVATCRSCHLLSLLSEELDQPAAALHSHKSQSLRLAALNRFKSGQVPILLATDVASRGLDIPTVDLVINYDIPRFGFFSDTSVVVDIMLSFRIISNYASKTGLYPQDYVHRVGRTARAGRGGLAVSFVTENDTNLVQAVEAVIGKQLDEYECKEKDVLADITKTWEEIPAVSLEEVKREEKSVKGGRGEGGESGGGRLSGCLWGIQIVGTKEGNGERNSSLAPKQSDHTLDKTTVAVTVLNIVGSLNKQIVNVYKAKRVATMKMIDDGYEETAKTRKAQKKKALAEKGLLKKRRRSQKS